MGVSWSQERGRGRWETGRLTHLNRREMQACGSNARNGEKTPLPLSPGVRGGEQTHQGLAAVARAWGTRGPRLFTSLCVTKVSVWVCGG